jgi:hypothetical protein
MIGAYFEIGIGCGGLFATGENGKPVQWLCIPQQTSASGGLDARRAAFPPNEPGGSL